MANRTPGERLLTPGLLADYLGRESERRARRLVRAMLRLIGTWPPQQAGSTSIGVPEVWAHDLELGGRAETSCRNEIKEFLRTKWWSRNPADPPTTMDHLAGFGRSVFDDVKSIALSILRRAYDAATTDDQQIALVQAVEQLHAAATRPSDDRVQADKRPRPSPGDLARTVCQSAVQQVPVEPLTVTAGTLATEWVDDTKVTDANWSELVGAFTTVAPTVALIAATAGSGELATYVRYLDLEQPGTDDTSVAARLFDLAAAEKALLPVEAGNLQKVEFVQLSADTRSWLAPSKATAQSKLTGLQVHNFGALQEVLAGERLDGAGSTRPAG